MAFLISPGLGEEVKEEVACNERKEGDENWEEDVHCAGNLLVRYLGHSSSLKHMERLSSISVSIQVPTWDILIESLFTYHLPSHIFCPCLLSPALCIYVWILQC